jgi:hypothetical protein
MIKGKAKAELGQKLFEIYSSGGCTHGQAAVLCGVSYRAAAHFYYRNKHQCGFPPAKRKITPNVQNLIDKIEWAAGLYSSGKTLAQVGKVFGVSIDSVHRTFELHGIKRRPPGCEEK